MTDGLDEDEAKEKVDRKRKDEDMDEFTSKYTNLIQYLLQLQNGKLRNKVMNTVQDLLKYGMNYQKAIRVSIRKYKPMLERYLDEA